MFRSIAVTAILSLALAAQANDGVELSLRNKALVSAGSTVKHADAPFSAGRDPLPQLLLLEEQELRDGPRGSCDYTAKALCYDLAEGRVVYRAAREYMPTVRGITPEGVSVRHNRVVFKYTFR